jgi:DNA-binding PadR family transcriptional regulator
MAKTLTHVHKETLVEVGVGDLSRDLDKEWRERFVRSHLDLVVLRLLRDKPKWGYEINIGIRDKFSVYLSAGTLYPLLHTLQDRGYVEGSIEPGARVRRIYKITPRGERFLLAGERVLQEILSQNLAGDLQHPPPKQDK